jgi:hypothetical protein
MRMSGRTNETKMGGLQGHKIGENGMVEWGKMEMECELSLRNF